jgi:hypothetical protein
MKPSYLKELENELKLKPSDARKPSNEQQTLECLLCNNIFTGIPKDKVSKFKKHHKVGCPKCIAGVKNNENKERILSKLKELGFELLEEYVTAETPVLLRKINCCGRAWKSRPHNICIKNPTCKPCRDDAQEKRKEENKTIPYSGMSAEYLNFLRDNVKLQVLDPSKTSNDHVDMQCLSCGNIFTATAKSKVTNFKKHKMPGCPKCTRYEVHKIELEKNKQRLIDMGYELLQPYRGKDHKILVRNKNCSCGRSWETKPLHIFAGRSFCRPCNDDKKRLRFVEQNRIRHEQSLEGLDAWTSYGKQARLLTEHTYEQYKDRINPGNLPRGRSGTEGAFHVDHIYSMKYCFYHNVPVELCAHVDNLQLLPWKVNAVKWKTPTSIIPDIIKPYVSTSDKYDNFYNSVQKHLNTTMIKNYTFKDVTGQPYTIPLYDKERKVGIMFLTFDDYVEQRLGTKSYLSKMKQEAILQGIKVLIIFEDEWFSNSSLVLSKLSHQFGLNNSSRIYARKCEIREVTSIGPFLKKNHIQGADGSQIKLGAFYNDKMVAVMTFAKPRKFMNKNTKEEGVWELSRFATDVNYIVVGIASKLLKHFQRNYEWKEVYSYADLRWSDGNVYEQLGFSLSGATDPNYFYIVDGQRIHRWGFRKSLLKTKFPNTFNPQKTEYENMIIAGYDRIWDCGHLKYYIQHP